MLLLKAYSFVKRDLLIEVSYKAAFVFELGTSILPVVSFFFLSRLISVPSSSNGLTRYGGDYFSFVLIGVAFSQYFSLALGSFAGSIRRAQMAGCLEAMLSTQTSPETVIIFSGLYGYLIKTLHIGLILALGGMLGARLSNANILGAGITLILIILAFSAFGIFAAALVLLTKKGDFVQWSLGSLGALLGGALFPISVMPSWLQALAHLVPMTYALDAMRCAVLNGSSFLALWRPLAALAAMTAVFLPLSVVVFSKAVAKGRRDGSLLHY